MSASRGSVTALSIDAVLVDRLRDGPLRGQVHSVFRRVLNIHTYYDQLIAVCVRGLDDAPWTIRADVDDWSDCPVSPDLPVMCTAEGVGFGQSRQLSVVFGELSKWYAKPAPLDLSDDELAARTRVLAGLLDRHGVRGGMRAGGPLTAFDAAVGAQLHHGRAELTRALLAGDAPAVERAVRGLLGLGPGLTPAGDDFLTGLAVVVAQPGSRNPLFGRIARDVVARHPGRTTLLSRTTLREALAGRARENVLDLLRRLLRPGGGEPAQLAEQLRGPVKAVVGIGHTSGTDLVSGVLTGLQLESEMRGSV